MESKTLINRISEKSNKFYKSKWSFITFLSLIFIVAFIQILLFSLSLISISGFNIGDKNSWASWVYLGISIPGSILSLIGYIYTIRVDSKFFIPTSISGIINTFTSIVGGMMWTGISILIVLFINLYRFSLMKRQGPDYSINEKMTYVIGAILVIIYLILGIVLASIDSTSVIWWNKNAVSGWVKYLDIFTSSIMLFGAVLLIGKNRMSFLIFLLVNILFIIMFIIASQYLSAVTILIFFISNLLAVLAWSSNNRDKKNEV